MKKVVAILLALLTLVSASCGNGADVPGTETIKETEAMTEEFLNKYPVMEREKDLSYLNAQSYRPIYHFSCEINGMNDPNGLWYDETTGIYHNYFQYDPRGLTVASQCVWGHAVSYDLMNWVELEPALKCEPKMKKMGMNVVASGSCVVDEDNTSGFFDESIDPKRRVVAIYTNLGVGKQMQSVAYSLDGGNSFICYEGNPVIRSGAENEVDFRDPKIVKYYDESYENGYIWVMIVAGGIVQLYTSENLTDWTFNSTLRNPWRNNEYVRCECPDLFELSSPEGGSKWVFTHSGSFYMMGELKKNENGLFEFVPEHDLRRFTTPNTAAFQSFYNTADGRRIGLAWQADFSAGYVKGFEDKTWNGCHSLPMELSLKKDPSGELRMYFDAVEETKLLRGEKLFSAEDIEVKENDSNILEGISSEHFELDCIIDTKDLRYVGFKLRVGEGEYIDLKFQKYDNSYGKIIGDFNKSSSLMVPVENSYDQELLIREDGTVRLRIFCDGMSFELYANDGENIIENVIFPQDSSVGMELYVNGTVNIKRLDIWEMKSIFGEGTGNAPEEETEKETEKEEARYESPTLPEDTAFCEMEIINVYEALGIPADSSSIVDAWASGKEGCDRGLTFAVKTRYRNTLDKAVNAVSKGDTWILGGGESIKLADPEKVFMYNGKPGDADFGTKVNGSIKEIFDGQLGYAPPYVWLGNLWAFEEDQKVPEGFYTFVIYKDDGSAVAFTEYVLPSFASDRYDYTFK